MNDEKSLLTIFYTNGAYGMFIYLIVYYFFLSRIRYLRAWRHKSPLLRKVMLSYSYKRIICHLLAMSIVYITHFFYDPMAHSVHFSKMMLIIAISMFIFSEKHKWETVKVRKEETKGDDNGFLSLLGWGLATVTLFYILIDNISDSSFDFRDVIAQGLYIWGVLEVFLVYISLIVLYAAIAILLYKFVVVKLVLWLISAGLLLLLGWWVVPFFSQVDMPLYGLMVLLITTLFKNRPLIVANHVLGLCFWAMIPGTIYLVSLLVNTVVFS